MAVLEVSGLTVRGRLSKGEAELVHGLSFSAEAGERLAVVGESGSGKTMTALSLLGLLPDNCTATGSLLLDGRSLLALSPGEMNALRGRELAYIPQSGADSLHPSLTVGYQMAETLRRLGLRGREAIRRRSLALLGGAGFSSPEGLLGKYPFQLSGGMAQRVVMAMGMAAAPRLVIADEPTRGLDAPAAAALMDGVGSRFPGAAVVIITHNIALAASCERLLVMRGGRRLEYGCGAELLARPEHPYTRSLIAALPENGLCLPEEAERKGGAV